LSVDAAAERLLASARARIERRRASADENDEND